MFWHPGWDLQWPPAGLEQGPQHPDSYVRRLLYWDGLVCSPTDPERGWKITLARTQIHHEPLPHATGPPPRTALGILSGHLSGPRAASHRCGTQLLWLLFPVAVAFISRCHFWLEKQSETSSLHAGRNEIWKHQKEKRKLSRGAGAMRAAPRHLGQLR